MGIHTIIFNRCFFHFHGSVKYFVPVSKNIECPATYPSFEKKKVLV